MTAVAERSVHLRSPAWRGYVSTITGVLGLLSLVRAGGEGFRGILEVGQNQVRIPNAQAWQRLYAGVADDLVNASHATAGLPRTGTINVDGQPLSVPLDTSVPSPAAGAGYMRAAADKLPPSEKELAKDIRTAATNLEPLNPERDDISDDLKYIQGLTGYVTARIDQQTALIAGYKEGPAGNFGAMAGFAGLSVLLGITACAISREYPEEPDVDPEAGEGSGAGDDGRNRTASHDAFKRPADRGLPAAGLTVTDGTVSDADWPQGEPWD